MVYEKFERLGNPSEIYVHIPRKAGFHGLVQTPDLILKLYEMHKRDRPLPEPLMHQSKAFLEKRIHTREILPLLGLGFAIVSEDMLNVARWDNAYPIVLKNQI